MNPPTFHGNMVDEDLQGFIDEVFQVVDYMGVIPMEKEALDSYQIIDVYKVWFE